LAVRRRSNEIFGGGAIACFVGAVTVAAAPGGGGWLGVGALVLFGATLFFLFWALGGAGIVDCVARKAKVKHATRGPKQPEAGGRDGDGEDAVWELPQIAVGASPAEGEPPPDTWEAFGRRYAPMSEEHQGDLKALARHALEGVQAGQPARYVEDGDGRHDLAPAFAEHFYDTARALVDWNDALDGGDDEQIESARGALIKRLERVRDTEPILGGGGCAICRPQQPS
jgi:hypothetical protein